MWSVMWSKENGEGKCELFRGKNGVLCYKVEVKTIISGAAKMGRQTPKPGALPTGPHPDIELKKNARCGQICGQEKWTSNLANF